MTPKPVSVSPGWSDEPAGSCGRPSSRCGARPPSGPEGATLSAGAGAEGGAEQKRYVSSVLPFSSPLGQLTGHLESVSRDSLWEGGGGVSAWPKHIYDDGRIHTQFVLLCCVANSNNRVFLLVRVS